jgi:hypothetical protein
MSSKPAGYSRAAARLKKPPKSSDFLHPEQSRLAQLEPVRPASATTIHAMVTMIPTGPAIPITIVAIHHAVLESMVPPTSTVDAASHMRQNRKPTLLAVIESLVERIGGISDFLHRRRHRRHVVGAFAQARHRIAGLLHILCIIRLRIHSSIGAIDPQLGEIPHRRLDRRPQFFLIGVKLQPGLDRGNPRIRKGRPVLRAHAHVLVKPLTVLRIGNGRTSDGERRNAGEKDFLHVNLL